MNKNELKIKERYEKQGWKVLRGGAPDFLCLKVKNGKITDAKFVEVKYGNGRLTYEQQIWRKVLERFLGLKYSLEYLPNHPFPNQTTTNQLNPNLTVPNQTTHKKEQRKSSALHTSISNREVNYGNKTQT